MALASGRNLVWRDELDFEGPMAASAECFQGALLVRDSSGNVKPATAAASLIACGFCREYAIESTGVAAASDVKYRIGCAKMRNSSSNPADKSHVGDTLYIEDDETVTTDATGTSAAGICVDVESDGVWVLVLPQNLAATGLLAANNLSDVGSASTAATNLGLGTTDSPTFADVTTTDDVVVGDDLTVTGLATVGETFDVTGITTLAALLNADGGIAVDTNKFTVSAAGAVAVASTLEVTGATTLNALLNADAGIAVDTNKFTVSAAGAVTVASTLGVTGVTTLTGLLNANAGIAVDTTAFTVAGDGTGNTAIAGTLGVTGVTTPTGGVAAAASMSARPGGVCHTGGLPARVSTDGTNAAFVNTEYYTAEVFVPCNMSITGVSLFNGATVGTDSVHAALAYSDGTIVAGSATGAVATSGADAYQNIPFSGGPITVLGPATYFIVFIPSGATDTYNAHPFGNFRAGKVTGRTYGAITSFTPPSTFTADLGPIASLY
jgi:hypothetical protein